LRFWSDDWGLRLCEVGGDCESLTFSCIVHGGTAFLSIHMCLLLLCFVSSRWLGCTCAWQEGRACLSPFVHICGSNIQIRSEQCGCYPYKKLVHDVKAILTCQHFACDHVSCCSIKDRTWAFQPRVPIMSRQSLNAHARSISPPLSEVSHAVFGRLFAGYWWRWFGLTLECTNHDVLLDSGPCMADVRLKV
jgi:hypothetical protein